MAPLVGAFPGLSSIELYIFGYLIPSQILVVVAGAVVLGVAYFATFGKGARSMRRIAFPMLVLFCIMGFWGLACAWASGGAVWRVLVQVLWMTAPILFATFLIGMAKKRNVCFSSLSEIIVVGAALFSCMLIAYNVGVYGFNVLTDRLYCPGLGPVVLGYTNALAIALAVSRKGDNAIIAKPLMCLAVIVLLVATFLTGSRGGIYPALALAVVYFLPSKNAAAMVLLVLGALIVLLVFDPVDAFLSGRAGSLQSGRYDTWEAALASFCDGTHLDRLLGYGLGNVFPYQDWYTDYYTGHIERGYTDGDWNSFSFRGNTMLVEPHNTYIWLLLEGGLFSLVGFIFCLVAPIAVSPFSVRYSKLRFGVVLATFMILGIFDAVVFVNAASAFWWSVLFVAFEASIESEGDLV